MRVRAGRPGFGTPLSAPVVLLRVRSPLPSAVETPCPNCFLCVQASGRLGQPCTSVLSVYKLSARLGRNPQSFCTSCLCARSVSQLCSTLRPHGLWPSGSSVHRISQARILEWVAISFSKRFSRRRDQTRISCVSCIDRRIVYH